MPLHVTILIASTFHNYVLESSTEISIHKSSLNQLKRKTSLQRIDTPTPTTASAPVVTPELMLDTMSAPADRITVSLPDLAISFLAQEPEFNHHYEIVSRASDDWEREKCDLDPKGKRIIEVGDFAYFVAVAVSNASLSRFRCFSDWIHWVFPFDDMFDIGELKDDPKAAKEVLNDLVDSMQGTAIPGTKWAKAHQDLIIRMKRVR